MVETYARGVLAEDRVVPDRPRRASRRRGADTVTEVPVIAIVAGLLLVATLVGLIVRFTVLP